MLNLAVCKVTTELQTVHISLMKCYKARSCALCKVRCSLWHRHYTCMYLNNSNKYSRISRGTQCSIQMRCSHSRLFLWSISCSTNHTHTHSTKSQLSDYSLLRYHSTAVGLYVIERRYLPLLNLRFTGNGFLWNASFIVDPKRLISKPFSRQLQMKSIYHQCYNVTQ